MNNTGRYTLLYVCKACGAPVAEFTTVLTDQPAAMSVCDKAECRAKVSLAWKAA